VFITYYPNLQGGVKMIRSNIQDQVGDLLHQIANLVGVQSPLSSTSALSSVEESIPANRQQLVTSQNETELEHRAGHSGRQSQIHNTQTIGAREISKSNEPGPSRRLQSSNVLAELRRNFAPYDLGNNSSRVVGRIRHLQSRRPSSQGQRSWSHDFFCFSSPEDKLTPTHQRSLILIRQHDLGRKTVTTSMIKLHNKNNDVIKVLKIL